MPKGMFIVLLRKFIFVKSVIINIIRIRFHLNIKGKLSRMIPFSILDFVIIINPTKTSFFVKFVMYLCALVARFMAIIPKESWRPINYKK